MDTMELKNYNRTVSADDSGFQYETKVTALVALRLFNSGRNFFLGSNVELGDKFDDIVFSVEREDDQQTWNSWFIQLKHKQQSTLAKKKITQTDLYKGKKGSKDFHLMKYYEGFNKVMAKFKLLEDTDDNIFGRKVFAANFILYTNAILNEEVLKIQHSLIDLDLLSSNPSQETNIQFAFSNINNTNDLQNYIGRTLLDGNIFNINDVQNFFGCFCFCSGQASEDNINDLTLVELKKATNGLNPTQLILVLNQFCEKIRWWGRQEHYVTKDDITTFLNTISLRVISGKRSKIGVDFTPVFLCEFFKLLTPGIPLLLTMKAEGTELCMAALGQLGLLEEPNTILPLKDLENDNVNVLLSEWSSLDLDRALLVDCQGDLRCDQPKIIDFITQLVLKNPKNRIIFVATQNNLTVSKLCGDLKAKRQKFNCSLSNLTKASIASLLEREIKFQGHNSTLAALLSGSKVLNGKLDISALTKLLGGRVLDIGIIPVDVIDYYVPRVLRRKAVSSSIFKDTSKAIFALSGISLEKAIDSLPISAVQIISSREVLQLGIIPADKPVKVVILEGYNNLPPNEEFVVVSNMITNVHWLTRGNNNNTWFWHQSVGNANLISDHYSTTSEYVSTDNIMAVEGKIVVIAAEPGMGKTTLLNHMALKTKEANPHLWVISIPLNDFTKFFAQPNFIKNLNANCKKLVTEAAGVDSSTSKFDSSLLDHYYDVTGNIVLLLDGFDEISPTYTKEGLALLRALAKSKLSKVWVSTRPVMCEELQRETSTQAFELQPFGPKEQKSFLTKYWKKYEEMGELDKNTFITHVLNLVKDSFDDEINLFAGIALQIRMIADIFEPYLKEYQKSGSLQLPKKIDGLTLFTEFVNVKLGIHMEEKSKIASTYASAQGDLKQLNEMRENRFMQMALLTLLPLSECTKLVPPVTEKDVVELKKYVHEGNEKTGLVVSFKNSPVFIHRTFAEYYVAKYFSDPICFKANRSFLLSDAFFSTPVRYFFDRILASGKPLHLAILDRDTDLSPTLLTNVNDKDLGGRTALHLAASLPDSEVVVKKLLEAGADPDTVDGLLGWKPLEYAVRLGIMQNIAPLLEKSNLADVPRNAVPITWESMHAALLGDYLKLFLYLLNNEIASVVGMDTLAELPWIDNASNKGLTLLHVAAWHDAENVLGYLLRPDSRDCKLSQLERRDSQGRTPLILSVINKSSSALKRLLKAGADILVTTKDNKDILQLAAEQEDEALFTSILNEGKQRKVDPNKFLAGAITQIIGNKSEWGINMLETLVLIYGKSLPTHTKKGVPVLSAACIKANEAAVTIFLETSDVNVTHMGHAPLHFAVIGSHNEIVQTLLCSKELNIDLVDATGCTALYLAVSKGFASIVKILIDHGASVTAGGGKSSLAEAAVASNNIETVDILLGFISIEEFNKLVPSDPSFEGSLSSVQQYISGLYQSRSQSFGKTEVTPKTPLPPAQVPTQLLPQKSKKANKANNIQPPGSSSEIGVKSKAPAVQQKKQTKKAKANTEARVDSNLLFEMLINQGLTEEQAREIKNRFTGTQSNQPGNANKPSKVRPKKKLKNNNVQQIQENMPGAPNLKNKKPSSGVVPKNELNQNMDPPFIGRNIVGSFNLSQQNQNNPPLFSGKNMVGSFNLSQKNGGPPTGAMFPHDVISQQNQNIPPLFSGRNMVGSFNPSKKNKGNNSAVPPQQNNMPPFGGRNLAGNFKPAVPPQQIDMSPFGERNLAGNFKPAVPPQQNNMAPFGGRNLASNFKPSVPPQQNNKAPCGGKNLASNLNPAVPPPQQQQQKNVPSRSDLLQQRLNSMQAFSEVNFNPSLSSSQFEQHLNNLPLSMKANPSTKKGENPVQPQQKQKNKPAKKKPSPAPQ